MLVQQGGSPEPLTIEVGGVGSDRNRLIRRSTDGETQDLTTSRMAARSDTRGRHDAQERLVVGTLLAKVGVEIDRGHGDGRRVKKLSSVGTRRRSANAALPLTTWSVRMWSSQSDRERNFSNIVQVWGSSSDCTSSI